MLINSGLLGSMQFIGLCQEINGGYPRNLIKSTEDAEEFIKLYTAGLTLYPKMVEGVHQNAAMPIVTLASMTKPSPTIVKQ